MKKIKKIETLEELFVKFADPKGNNGITNLAAAINTNYFNVYGWKHRNGGGIPKKFWLDLMDIGISREEIESINANIGVKNEG